MDGKKEGYLDDITWNDLEMDVIFGRINQTLTTAGEEYLYRLLRLPKMSSKELEHLGELTNFFQSHKKNVKKCSWLGLSGKGQPLFAGRCGVFP